MSLNTVDSIPEQTKFIQLELTMEAGRNRLSVLLQHIQFVAKREQVDERKIAALVLELSSNRKYDREISKVCEEIIKTGTFDNALKKPSTIYQLLIIY